MKFFCDDNLGKLAKLLRAAGYDTLFYRTIRDGELISRALKDKRFIITRDRGLIGRGAPEDAVLLIEGDNPDEQFEYVILQMNLHPEYERWLTRCIECNNVLCVVNRKDYVEQIPPYVYKTHDEFYRCPGCERLYWKGTHHKRLTERLGERFRK
ncbi:MAG: hypothetical protein GF307_04880 [candidate division Zixibacteria bacterium]|nr:hypothetical protein [candidate division Zixibacteria bacterium]